MNLCQQVGIAPQIDLAVSSMEGHEDLAQVAADGQPPVPKDVPVFQHVLAHLLKPSSTNPPDDKASADDVPQSGANAPGDAPTEESSQTVPSAPEATQAVLAQFASLIVPVQTPLPLPSVVNAAHNTVAESPVADAARNAVAEPSVAARRATIARNAVAESPVADAAHNAVAEPSVAARRATIARDA
ncbi:MAG: hypothetical protein NZT92_08510, partial [Abditibacteriales bacterium]|nr:hypothetical protein [Abditibacteriales bacterium]MDW8365996.1 hypothetical protein [Abditibacteriales bacterium]